MNSKQELVALEVKYLDEIAEALKVPHNIEGLETNVDVSFDSIYVRLVNKKYFWSSEVMTLYLRRQFDSNELDLSYNHGSGGELAEIDPVELLKIKAEMFLYGAEVLERVKKSNQFLLEKMNELRNVRKLHHEIQDIENQKQRDEADARFFNTKTSELLKEGYRRIRSIEELTPEEEDYLFTLCTFIDSTQKCVREVMILCDTCTRTTYKFDRSRIKKSDLKKMIEESVLYVKED